MFSHVDKVKLVELRQDMGIVGAYAREALADGVLSELKNYQGDEAIFRIQSEWNWFATGLDVVAPLEAWDTYLAGTAQHWAYEYQYLKTHGDQPVSRHSQPWQRDMNQYTRFLTSNVNNPYVAQNPRVYIDLAQLSHRDFQKLFPLVSKTSAETLLGLFKLIMAAMGEYEAPPTLVDTYRHLGIQNVPNSPGVPQKLQDIANRIITTGLWWLYQTRRIADIDRFMAMAAAYLKDSSRFETRSFHMVLQYGRFAQFIITLAALDLNQDLVQRTEVHWAEHHADFFGVRFSYDQSRRYFLATLKEHNFTAPLEYLTTIWEGLEPIDKDRPMGPMINVQNQWLDNEGHLHVAVPRALLDDPRMASKIATPQSILDQWKPKAYSFTPHIEEQGRLMEMERAQTQAEPATHPTPTPEAPGLAESLTRVARAWFQSR
ncbi:hypothetical protein H4R33_004388 [Dimargaris cristalligena]|nr:hypothetical protein H4R33_004388 [Dimargaris cristalligena]